MNIHPASLTIEGSLPPSAIGLFAMVDPDAIALHDGASGMTYREFTQRGAALADAFSAAGAGAGDLVAVCMARSPQQIIALYAAWLIGAAYLPLDPEWPDSRLADLLARSRARLLVMPPDRAAAVAQGTPVIDPAVIDAPHALDRTFSPDRAAPAPDALAYVIYTSGSTGDPKGVEVTHANLAALIRWHNEAFALQPGMRSSHLAGLAFDAAVWEVWPVLASGGTLVIPRDETLRYDAPRLAAWLVEQAIDVAFAPTVTAEQLIGQHWPAATALRVLLTGGDRLKLRPRPGLPFRLVNNYGPTECTVVASSGIVAPEGAANQGLPAIGEPIGDTIIHIVDAQGELAVEGEESEGEEGEIWIAGPQVARGYRGDPALTAERFPNHPRWGRLYRTGDLARRDANGQIHFLGRLDAQIQLRGHRIEPAEIETALLQADGIAAAAVAVRGDALTAWLVPVPGHCLTAAGLRGQLARHLPAPMLPSRFALIEALPLNASGKLDRDALPDPALTPLPESDGDAMRAPSSPTEQRLADIVAEVIGRADFGVDDDFFLLGGHSLLGTQVIVRAREAFGVELTLLHLFEARTVARLAAAVEELITAHLASLSDEDIARMMKK